MLSCDGEAVERPNGLHKQQHSNTDQRYIEVHELRGSSLCVPLELQRVSPCSQSRIPDIVTVSVISASSTPSLIGR